MARADALDSLAGTARFSAGQPDHWRWPGDAHHLGPGAALVDDLSPAVLGLLRAPAGDRLRLLLELQMVRAPRRRAPLLPRAHPREALALVRRHALCFLFRLHAMVVQQPYGAPGNARDVLPRRLGGRGHPAARLAPRSRGLPLRRAQFRLLLLSALPNPVALPRALPAPGPAAGVARAPRACLPAL